MPDVMAPRVQCETAVLGLIITSKYTISQGGENASCLMPHISLSPFQH